MADIKINSVELAKIILANSDKIGSTDWNIYVSVDGNIECRHSTLDSLDWIEVVELYSFWDDEDTLSCSDEELGEWLKTDGIPSFDDNRLEWESDDNRLEWS